jgi:hypothetical protein
MDSQSVLALLEIVGTVLLLSVPLFVVAEIAKRRGRSHVAWFLLSIAITPVLAILVVLALPRIGDGLLRTGEHIRCPLCLSIIPKAAIRCQACGGDLRGTATA